MALSWFTYSNSGSAQDPQQYNLVTTTPTCNQGNTICAIFAEVQLIGEPAKSRPVISGALSAEIHAAQQNLQPSPNVKLKAVN